MFNQVAVFQSPTALAGEEDWGTPDELDAAFAGTCEQVQQGLPLMWRDKLVADVRPRPDPDLGARADRPARRRRPPPAAVHGAGRHHGDRGRLGAGRARVPAAAGPQRRRARLGHRARGLRRRTPRALPAGALHRPRRGASCGTTTASSGCSATRSCERATPTTTPSPSGSTAPRPWSPRTSPSSTRHPASLRRRVRRGIDRPSGACQRRLSRTSSRSASSSNEVPNVSVTTAPSGPSSKTARSVYSRSTQPTPVRG